MKILVTGGAGFIASHVVDLYISQGHEVIVVDNLATGRLSNLNPEAKFYKMDIRDDDLRKIFEIEGPEIINHHAAHVNVRNSVVDPIYDADVNLMGSLHLIDLAREYQIKRFIYTSSGGAVYGEPEYLPCNESHPVNPICPYGATKHFVEQYLYMYERNFGMPYIVLRYPNVYGPRQDMNGEAGVISIFIGNFLKGETPHINGDGEQTRDYVFIDDCARANLIALYPKIPSGIYNLGSGVGTSVNQLFELLKSMTNSDIKSIHNPPKLGETRHIYLDASKAKSILGWEPTIDLQQGLKQTIDYIKEYESQSKLRTLI